VIITINALVNRMVWQHKGTIDKYAVVWSLTAPGRCKGESVKI
jgi:hypothetical protein